VFSQSNDLVRFNEPRSVCAWRRLTIPNRRIVPRLSLEDTLDRAFACISAIIARHGLGHTFGIVHAVGACVIGLLFTVLYEWRQTLTTPIMVHADSNFLSAIALIWVMWTTPGTPILGVSGDTGPSCVVQSIVPDSAATNASIQRSDVIITFNTERIRDFPHLVETVGRYRPGDRIPMSIERAGSPKDLEVVLGRRGE
jgi:hypothetical protein